MPRSHLMYDRKGVAGFFEDIPALIVVIIAFGIFLMSIVSAFTAFQAQQEAFRMHQKCIEFIQTIRVYDKLTYNSIEGVFQEHKVLGVNQTTVETDFNSSSLGFEYLIIINDVSDYPSSKLYKRNFQTESPPTKASKYTMTSSIVIRVLETYHAGQLIVTIWE